METAKSYYKDVTRQIIPVNNRLVQIMKTANLFYVMDQIALIVQITTNAKKLIRLGIAVQMVGALWKHVLERTQRQVRMITVLS